MNTSLSKDKKSGLISFRVRTQSDDEQALLAAMVPREGQRIEMVRVDGVHFEFRLLPAVVEPAPKAELPAPAAPAATDSKPAAVELANKTIEELQTLAAMKGIAVPKNAKRADIIDLIAKKS